MTVERFFSSATVSSIDRYVYNSGFVECFAGIVYTVDWLSEFVSFL
jgi:hypothetical protein